MKRQIGPKRFNPMVEGRRAWLADMGAKYQRVEEAPRIGEAIQIMLATKKKLNYRPSTLVSLRQYLNMFARERESMPLTDVTAELIEAWFDSRTEAMSSVNGSLGRISSLLQFAWRKGWIIENPVRKMEKIRFDQIVPPILTVRQSMKVLIFTKRERPRRLASVVLMLLAGLRPDEARLTKWEDINLSKGTVRVAAANSKVRRRRVVHMMPAAVAWLRLAADLESWLPTPKTGSRRWIRQLRNMLGWKRWKQDVFRHTCASMWVAEWRDHARVAYELGHSPDMLRRHYLELVEAEDAKRFWGMVPRPREEVKQRRLKALEQELQLPELCWRLAS